MENKFFNEMYVVMVDVGDTTHMKLYENAELALKFMMLLEINEYDYSFGVPTEAQRRRCNKRLALGYGDDAIDAMVMSCKFERHCREHDHIFNNQFLIRGRL